MTARSACPPALEPLKEYAAQYDELFGSPQQRRGFRDYLTGLIELVLFGKHLSADRSLSGHVEIVEGGVGSACP